jgi:predicted AAA+ superfamily ATPase
MKRIFPKSLEERWKDPKGLIQVLTGPRQVGKTFAAQQLMVADETIFASADLPTPPTANFIMDHWISARKVPAAERTLVLDEVQKIPRWSEVVKGLWDEDQKNKIPLRVCLLGSSALLIEKGLSESLMGRFEASYFPHWTYRECRQLANINWETYIRIGGYPKAYDFVDSRDRLENYLQNSILEPTLGRDILSLHSVDKPALLRQLFWYVSRLPSRIVSYEKILGHLQGQGNSATLVHYADLLSKAFLICPISKYSYRTHRTKRSIPKWILPNPALVAQSLRNESHLDGFVIENAVGGHLLNLMFGNKDFELLYWRDGTDEIDFVVTRHHEPLIAIEVKSGRSKGVPDLESRKKSGLTCSFITITLKNIEPFFDTCSIESICNF